MGFLAIGLWLYTIVVISLCASLVWHTLINARKMGFWQAVKSKTAVTIIIFIFICSVVPPLLVIWESIPRSDNELFENYVREPVPESVKILDSFDGVANFYPDECLHFKISPADFQLILATKNWRTAPENDLGGFQCGNLDAHWYFTFTPPSFGKNVVTYTFIPREKDIEVMFVNSQMSEVYYFYHDGNMP